MTKRKVLFVIGGVMAVTGLLILAPFGDVGTGIQTWEALFSMIAMLASLTSFVFGSRARPGEKFEIRQRNITHHGDAEHVIYSTGDNPEIKVETTHYHNTDPEERDKKEQALIQSYLTDLADRVGVVDLAGIDQRAASKVEEAQFDLASVYTALYTLTSEEEKNMVRGEMAEFRHAEKRLSVLASLDRSPKLVILGDPGSGKSTFVKFIALCMAGELLRDESTNLSLLCQPLPGEEEPQKWTRGILFPVQVILRDFAARGLPASDQAATSKHIMDFLKSDFEERGLGEAFPLIERKLKEDNCIILFDGLDEVPVANKRREQIKQAVESFAAQHSKAHVLVTSRTYAYQEQAWQLSKFDSVVLAPFNQDQIHAFIDKWYDYVAIIRNLHSDQAKGNATLLKNAIDSNSRLQALASRPLLLTLMSSLHAWRNGKLPDKREELYHETVDLLLDRWEQQRRVRKSGGEEFVEPSLQEYLKVGKEDIRHLLNRLAYDAHRTQPDTVGTADIPSGELLQGLLDLSKSRNANLTELEGYLSNRAGLLIPRGVGVYTFPHRTFQEYLAACYLTDHDEYPNIAANLGCDQPERWREVVLLAGAKTTRGQANAVWSLVDELCYKDVAPQELRNEKNYWGSLLGGQALLENARLDPPLSDRNQKRLDLVKTWLAATLEENALNAVERVEAGLVLAQLGEIRQEVLTLEKMPFCYVPAGKFKMGEDEEQHELDLPAYYISKYPVTNAQYQFFVDAGGYADESLWEEAIREKVWKDGGVKGLWDSGYRTSQMNLREPFLLPNYPVVGITWYEMLAYTRWLTVHSRQQGWLSGEWVVQLPNEPEWEKTARGGFEVPVDPVICSLADLNCTGTIPLLSNPLPARLYPWGDDFDPEATNTEETAVGSTSAVGCFPAGKSPYGVEDLSGNVWEWTRNIREDYPYDKDDGREDFSRVTDRSRLALRGGSFYNDQDLARCAYRDGYPPNYVDYLLGFRVVVVASPHSS